MHSTPEAVAAPPTTLRFAYRAEPGELFVVALKVMVLTVVTLGIYSAWGRVSMLRALIEGVEADGDRLRFHGRGGEVFRGVLIALAVVVALYALTFGVIALLDQDLTWLAVVAFYVGFGALAGAALFGSFRYRMTRTSWRGVRFAVRPELGDFLGEFFVRSLLTLVTLGIALPWFQCWQRGALLSRASFGTERLGFDGQGQRLIGPFLLAVVLTLPTLGFVWLWYEARLKREQWNGTTFGRARFRLEFDTSEWCVLRLGWGLAVLLTLGIAWAWATAAVLRYLAEHLALEGPLDLEAIRAVPATAPATGEGLSDLLDGDFDLG